MSRQVLTSSCFNEFQRLHYFIWLRTFHKYYGGKGEVSRTSEKMFRLVRMGKSHLLVRFTRVSRRYDVWYFLLLWPGRDCAQTVWTAYVVSDSHLTEGNQSVRILMTSNRWRVRRYLHAIKYYLLSRRVAAVESRFDSFSFDESIPGFRILVRPTTAAYSYGVVDRHRSTETKVGALRSVRRDVANNWVVYDVVGSCHTHEYRLSEQKIEW